MPTELLDVIDFDGYSDTVEPDEFCFQLIESIQTIDTRISELKIIRALTEGNPDGRLVIRERVEALLHTRFTLVYVFMDTVASNKNSVFGTLNPNYKELSRHIEKMMIPDILAT